jgi:hypothetical protein
MREYNVNRIAHRVFDEEDDLPKGLVVQDNWRKAHIGDWVRADDNCIIQILRKGEMLTRNKVREYVGTCTGTFPVGKTMSMDTSRRDHIYSFGGKKPQEALLDRTANSKHETLFIQYMVSGMTMPEAYMKAFPTKQIGYATERSAQLMKLERIRSQVKEELKPVLKKLGIDDESVLSDIKDVSQSAEKEDVRLRALFKLSDILDLEDKTSTKVTQITGALFQGFTPDALEAVERPEIAEGDK